MRLYHRIGDIIAANLNDLVDRFEDPELMLKQAIREMESMIDATTVGAAKAIAADRMLARRALEQERNAQHWHACAEQAVRNGDDAMARAAISRSHEHEHLAQVSAEEHLKSGQTTQVLRDQLIAMRAKLDEARQKLASLQARRLVANSSLALHSVSSSTTALRNGFARFAQLSPRLEQAALEADALAELSAQAECGVDLICRTRERTERVEATLNSIKQRQATQ